MTISQQIAKSLRTDACITEDKDDEIFDLDEHLRASSKKVLLQKINFVGAHQSYHFNLKKLKSKYVILNPSNADSKKNTVMSPALKLNHPSITENNSTHDGIPPPKMTLFSPDKIELSWKKPMRSGAGLCNLGNTCFLNSALQCLSYTAPLANYLSHMDHRKHCKSGGQFCMLCAMQQHLYNIHSNSGQAIKPMNIIKNLRMIAKHLQSGRQEDAHEFIRYSVDAMQRACLFGYPSKMDVHIKATTVIHQIFGGYLRSRVKCKQCKSVSDTYDPFLDLSLDINKQGCVDLQRCLEMFVRIEVLQGDNAYKCMQCKNSVQACKKFSIHRAPNILMIQLKRFSNFMGNKINKELVYPSKLNIGPYMSNKPDGGYWYELYAVLVHSGYSCQSGHYYAYAKAPNGQWYCFNDSSVHQVSVNQALNQQAYLLFYSRNQKVTTQLGNMKSLNKNPHNFGSINKAHTQQFNTANGLRANQPTMIKNNLRTIIGPKLPPNVKREKDMYTFQSTSSSSDTGSPLTKQSNQVKIINRPTSIMKPSGNTNRQPFQFTINRKPNVANSQALKLTNGGQSSTMTKSQSFNAKNTNNNQVKHDVKSSTLPANATGSLRSPILDKLLQDSNIASSSTSHSSLSSAASTSGSVGLKAIVSYYSDEDNESANENDDHSKSDYSSLTSTLQQLRKESSSTVDKTTNSGKKITVKGTVNLPVGVPGNITLSDADSTTSSKNEMKDFVQQSSKSLNTEKSSQKKIAMINVKTPEVKSTKLLSSPKSVRRDSAAEREPILHLLNNEINSSSDQELNAKNIKSNDVVSSSTEENHKATKRKEEKKISSGIEKERKLEGKANAKENGFGKIKECKNGVRYEKEHKCTVGKKSNGRGIHKSKKERKRHYSSDSSSSQSPPSRKKKDERQRARERSPSSSPRHQKHSRKSSTPTKKRKKNERRRHEEYDSSDEHERRKAKHHKATKRKEADSENTSSKHKKRDRKSFNPLKRSHSKTNGHLSDGTDPDSPKRSSSLEALYCDKMEYERSVKRKAKKEKKRRIRERKMLQTSINEESSENNDCDRSPRGHRYTTVRYDKHDRSRESSNSGESKKNRSRDYENGDQRKKKEKSSKSDRDCQSNKKQNGNESTKERPNILFQLLKQSAGKAYGVKVDTWNGGESVVEKDAEQTYLEQKNSTMDDWDREYDKGKTKKVKKKDYQSKSGPVHNLFQKFQNMKNQRHGE